MLCSSYLFTTGFAKKQIFLQVSHLALFYIGDTSVAWQAERHAAHAPPVIIIQPTAVIAPAGPVANPSAPHAAAAILQALQQHASTQVIYKTPGAVTTVNCVDRRSITNNQSIWNVFILSLPDNLLMSF